MARRSWRLRRPGDGAVETSLINGQITDTYNRFARTAEVVLPDPDGSKVAAYPQYTPVAIDVTPAGEDPSADFERFGGFVSNPQTGERDLTLEILSHDRWLRRRNPFVSYTGTTVETILEDLVGYTPLVWDPALVDVLDNVEITDEWKGEVIATIMDDLASASGGEEFGATNDGRFFFRQRDATKAPRQFVQGEYYDADFEQNSKAEVNRAVVYYGQGSSESVAVQDRQSQSAIADELGFDDPVVIEEQYDHPEITNHDAARRKARSYLDDATTIRTGEVNTWGAFDVEPGMVTNVVVPRQAVDGEYRVAEINYSLRDATTDLTLAENDEGVTDVLVNLSEETGRVDLKGADAQATPREIVSVDQTVLIASTVTVTGDGGTTIEAGRASVTNAMLRRIRDAWRGESPIDVAEVAVGDDATAPSRSDTDLGNQLEATAAAQTLPDATGVTYDGTVGASAIREVGLVAADGSLLARAALPDATLTAPVDVEYALAIDDGPGTGVVTTLGQTAVRDVIADNGPAVPTTYAYGDDSTAAAESDTSLGNQLVAVDFYDVQVQSADTNSEWSTVTQ